MSKLVDKERLAKLAKALDNRAKAAVEAEATRAMAAEGVIDALAKQNQAAIEEIKGEKGLLAQANAAIATEKERAELAEQGLSDRIDTLDAKFGDAADDFFNDLKGDESTTIGGMVADIAESQAKLAGIADEEGAVKEGAVKAFVEAAVAGEKERAEEQEGELANKIAALELKVNGGEGEGQDSIDDKIAAAQAAAEDKAAELDAALKTELEEAIGEKVAQSAYDTKIAEFEGRITANEAFVDAHDDTARDARITALEDANKEGGAVANAIAAAQDAADAAQADVDAVEQRLDAEGGLVDRIEANEANIARLDGAEDVEGSIKKQIKVAVADEKDRAEEEAAAIRQEMATEAQRVNKKIADDIAAESALRVAEEQRIEKECDEAMAQEVIDRNAAIEVEKLRAEGQEAAIRQELANEKAALQKEIDDDVLVVSNALNAEKERVAGVEAGFESRIAANEGALEIINGDGAGSIKKAEADAKAHAEAKIAELVDSAPDAMNTLNELAKAINDNKDVYDGYVAEHATAMTTMKTELQAEIDADVKVVADELAKQKNAEEAGSLAHKIAQEVSRAEGEESRIEGLVTAEATKAREEEGKLQEAINTINAKDLAQDGKIAALEAAVGLGGEGNNALEDLEVAIGVAQAAADKAQGEVDAVEVRLDAEGGLVDRLEAAEAFVAAQPAIDEAQQDAIDDLVARMEAMEAFEDAHDHSVMEKGIADNKAAIEKEVEDRDAAIEAALEAYSTTEEVKAILGNVVNSLALTMENNQVVLKLGGVDGIALTSVSLDVATDEDINAIIAGLDETAAE